MSTTTLETPEVSSNPFYMAGTEGTGEYVVLAVSSFGRVGYRLLHCLFEDAVRIRLEPASPAHAAKIAEVLTSELGWKQPSDNGQDRFSIVVRPGREALAALELAFGQVKRGRPIVYNPDKPDYKADLAA